MNGEVRVDVPRFWDQGYLVIRNVFSVAEIKEFRRHAFENRQRSGDLLSHPRLRSVILDDRVLSIAAQILEDTPAYYGDSTCNIGQQAFGYHKDNADRTDFNAPDWKSKYTQIRFGLYLQDHAWHSGGLRVVEGSHNIQAKVTDKRVNVRTRIGDLAVWNLRIDHAGSASMLRLLPWVYVGVPDSVLVKSYERPQTWYRHLVPLERPVRMKIPRLFLAGEKGERAALFFTMGREDDHLRRFVSYLKTRAYAIDNWKNSEYGPDVWNAVRGKNVKLIDVGDEVRRQLANGDPSLGANIGHAAIPY